MSKGRDEFPKPVVDALAKRAAFICSSPDCHAMTIAPSFEHEEKFIYVGVAAHICAAAEGGPRYDPTMSDDDRKAASNGIFLCSNCATMIDKNNGLDFPVSILHEWNRCHDDWVRSNLNKRREDQSSVVFNVESHGQSGGITAGIVNLGHLPRRLSAVQKQRMSVLPDRLQGTVVAFVSRLMDGESLDFATELASIFAEAGCIVPDVIKTSLNDLKGYLAISAIGKVDPAIPPLVAQVLESAGITAKVENIPSSSVGQWYENTVHVVVGRGQTH